MINFNSFARGDKVHLDDGVNHYIGFIEGITDTTLTLNIFVSDIDITFKKTQIVELEKV